MIHRNFLVNSIEIANYGDGNCQNLILKDKNLTILTGPQTEIYLNANNYKSVIFIGGRGAGKKFLNDIFLEEYLSTGKPVAYINYSGFVTEKQSRLSIKYKKLMKYIDYNLFGLRGLEQDIVLNILEPLKTPNQYDGEYILFDRFFITTTGVDFTKCNAQVKDWFLNLMANPSTLTVVGQTSTNAANLATLGVLQSVFGSNSVTETLFKF